MEYWDGHRATVKRHFRYLWFPTNTPNRSIAARPIVNCILNSTFNRINRLPSRSLPSTRHRNFKLLFPAPTLAARKSFVRLGCTTKNVNNLIYSWFIWMSCPISRHRWQHGHCVAPIKPITDECLDSIQFHVWKSHISTLFGGRKQIYALILRDERHRRHHFLILYFSYEEEMMENIRGNCNDKLHRMHKFVYSKNKLRIRHVVRSERLRAQLIYGIRVHFPTASTLHLLCTNRIEREKYMKLLFLLEALPVYGVGVGISYAFCATANLVHNNRQNANMFFDWSYTC